MRKITLALLAGAALLPASLPAPAFAQNTREIRHERQEVRRDQQAARREVRRDRQVVRRDRQEVRRDEWRDRQAVRRDEWRNRQAVRQDRREWRDEWRNYRERNREAYHRRAYYGPRGYSYRSVNVGYRFAPAYYSRTYWVDPVAYRLDTPRWYERWVRYGNDVLLVDIRNGRVLRVYNAFFW